MAPNAASKYTDFWPLGVISELDLDVAVVSDSGRFSPSSPGICNTSNPGSPFSSSLSTSSSSLALIQKSSKCKYRQQRCVAHFRSLVKSMSPFSMVNPCRMLSMPSQRQGLIHGSRVTGTIFGHRRGHVHIAVQEDRRSVPSLILEFSTPTCTFVQEMASGLVRIALECDKVPHRGKLYNEPLWSVFCNHGRRTGYAIRRVFSEFDFHVLSVVQAVSMGAGVIPVLGDSNEGELMYMRAQFERVIGSRDSEAFYMTNPEYLHGGPELSIFLLRI